MIKYNSNIKIKLISSILFVVIILMSSCNNNDNNDFDPPIPTPPLFNRLSTYETSIYSGNFLYNNFVASDFENIYFQGKDNSSLNKAEYNGNDKEVLISTLPYNINIVGDQIFFMNDSTNSMIHKIANDGTGHVVISNLNVNHFVAEYLYIFYVNENNNYVYRALHDGSENVLIFEKQIDKIYLSHDKVYLISNQEGVYVINNDLLRNIEDESISEEDYTFFNLPDNFESLNVNDSNIIYKSNNEIFVIDIESNITTSFSQRDILNSSKPFIVSSNNLFFINENDKNRLYKIDITNSKNKELVINDKVNEFVILGNSVYYRRENTNEIYRVSISGGYSSKIT